MQKKNIEKIVDRKMKVKELLDVHEQNLHLFFTIIILHIRHKTTSIDRDWELNNLNAWCKEINRETVGFSSSNA